MNFLGILSFHETARNHGSRPRLALCRPSSIRRRIAAAIAVAGVASQVARADDAAAAAAAAHARALRMQVYVVSATRVETSPWRYCSIPGFEILTRASDDATYWWIHALRSGMFIEDNILPAEWLPASNVPRTVIIDEANLAEVSASLVRTQAVDFESPSDALTWGPLSDRVNNWTNHFESFDNDTNAVEAMSTAWISRALQPSLRRKG